MRDFSERVIRIALSIPPGKVSTYGAVARAAGGGGQSARSVTRILGKACDAGQKGIPFHRIVYSDGSVWTNSAYDARRMKLYQKEGIVIGKKGRIENFRDVLMDFR